MPKAGLWQTYIGTIGYRVGSRFRSIFYFTQSVQIFVSNLAILARVGLPNIPPTG